MLVKELGGDWKNHLIAQSSLWNRHIEKLTPLDVSVFLRQHWGSAQYSEALRQVEQMIDLGWHATVEQRIENAPPITFFDPQVRVRITVDELCSWLSETTVARRRAILFALETGMEIQQIISLTWGHFMLFRPSLPSYAVKLAEANPRHIKLDYVFWEPMHGIVAAPLFGLAETMMEVSQGLGFDAFRRLYRDAIGIDTKADLESFSQTFCEEFDKQILKS